MMVCMETMLTFVADLFDDNRDFNIKVKAFGSKTAQEENSKNGFRSRY